MVSPANTAISVFGSDALDRRVQRISAKLEVSGTVLQRAIRELSREVLRRTPVDTGRLYRSFRINLGARRITLRFQARYAIHVNYRSRRNMRFVERGLRIGIRRANQIRRVVSDGAVVQFRFKLLRVESWGRGGIQAILSYEGL